MDDNPDPTDTTTQIEHSQPYEWLTSPSPSALPSR